MMRGMLWFGLVLLAAAPAGAKDPEGNWVGNGYQIERGRLASSWTIRIRAAANGELRIDYPSLGCGGVLRRSGVHEGRTEYRESLTYGTDRCIDRGTVGLTERAGRLFFYWIGEGTA